MCENNSTIPFFIQKKSRVISLYVICVQNYSFFFNKANNCIVLFCIIVKNDYLCKNI